MYLILDGEAISSKEMLHDVIAASLQLPEWYGRNLDALYDCLTDIAQPVDVILLHPDALQETLGSYATSLLRMLRDAAGENGSITIYRAVAE